VPDGAAGFIHTAIAHFPRPTDTVQARVLAVICVSYRSIVIIVTVSRTYANL